MRVAITYIFPLNGQGQHGVKAMRFLDTYHKHPPGLDHDTIIVCNGGEASAETHFMFSSLPNLMMMEHDDKQGQDIGGYQYAALHYPCDLMVFLGGNSYLRREGWLKRILESFQKHGDTLYGATAHRGVGNIHPHIRTTGFWMSPALLNQYPMRVTRNDQRYPFEHGPNCLTTWVTALGKTPLLVSWDGEYEWKNWDNVPNGYHKGDQSNVLIGDRLTMPPYHHCE